MLVLVRSFSYTPHTSFSEVFIVMLLVLVRNLSDLFVLILVRSFSYIPLASFINELYTPDTTFSEDRVSFTLYPVTMSRRANAQLNVFLLLL